MKTPKEARDNIHAALSAALPAVLTGAGLEDFGEYIKGTPFQADRKECAVYTGAVGFDEDYEDMTIIVQMTLPGMMEPDDYMAAVKSTVLGLDAQAMAGALTKRYDGDQWYPHEIQEGQSAFILWSLKFREELDVCDQY